MKIINIIVKIVQKFIKQETQKLEQEDLPIEPTQANHPPQAFLETFRSWEDKRNTEEIIDDIYSSRYVSLPAKEDAELERKLRELKFKQELRKDWILFLLKDVIVYSATVIFIFTVAGFYLVTLIYRY